MTSTPTGIKSDRRNEASWNSWTGRGPDRNGLGSMSLAAQPLCCLSLRNCTIAERALRSAPDPEDYEHNGEKLSSVVGSPCV